MKTRNRRHPDRLRWSEPNRENREHSYFPDASQILAMIGDFAEPGTVGKQRNLRSSGFFRRGLSETNSKNKSHFTYTMYETQFDEFTIKVS